MRKLEIVLNHQHNKGRSDSVAKVLLLMKVQIGTEVAGDSFKVWNSNDK